MHLVQQLVFHSDKEEGRDPSSLASTFRALFMFMTASFVIELLARDFNDCFGISIMWINWIPSHNLEDCKTQQKYIKLHWRSCMNKYYILFWSIHYTQNSFPTPDSPWIPLQQHATKHHWARCCMVSLEFYSFILISFINFLGMLLALILAIYFASFFYKLL